MQVESTNRVRSLSIAAPAYNEASGLEQVVEGWIADLRARPGLTSFEIVVCDDGSTDDTLAVLERLARRHPEVRPLSHRPNRGAGAAMRRAIAETRGDWVLLLDSDGQFPIASLDVLLPVVACGDARAVLGARDRKQDTAFARMGSKASGTTCNLLYGTSYRDFNSTCRLVDGSLLRGLELEADGLNYSTDVTAKLLDAGERPPEVIVPHLRRETGRSHRTAIRSTLDRLGFVLRLGARRVLRLAGRARDEALSPR